MIFRLVFIIVQIMSPLRNNVKVDVESPFKREKSKASELNFEANNVKL